MEMQSAPRSGAFVRINCAAWRGGGEGQEEGGERGDSRMRERKGEGF